MPAISPVYSFLKFLDQPQLLKRLEKAVPIALPLTGATYVAYDSLTAPDGQKAKRLVKGTIGMTTTIAFALAAVKLFREKIALPDEKMLNTALQTFSREGGALAKPVRELIQRAKSRVLAPKQVHTLQNALMAQGNAGEMLFDAIIPKPHNHSAVEILKEIGSLSALGAMPVMGGILGGVIGNKVTGENWRGALKNQSKEGLYQFLANIFLCNVGAGGALYLLEKTPVKNRAARLAAMSAGIFVAGIWGGNAIANFIGENFFNPLCDKGPSHMVQKLKHKVNHHGWGSLFKNLNAERHAELVDIGIHADDMATVGVLSGLKWIECSLPFLYTLCGYRSMIGYRNGTKPAHHAKHADKHADKPQVQVHPQLHVSHPAAQTLLTERPAFHAHLANGFQQGAQFRGFQLPQAAWGQVAQ